MDLSRTKLISFAVETELGIPYVDDATLLTNEPWLADLSLRERHTRFWTELDKSTQAMSRGLLLVPMSGNDEGLDIPSKRGKTDWTNPRGKTAIQNFADLFSDKFRGICDQMQTSAIESSQQMLDSVGLVSGTVSVVLPILPADLGRWAEDKNLERFIQGLAPGWIGLYPNDSRKGTGRILRRFEPWTLDLSRFRMDKEAIDQKRHALILLGYAPSTGEPVDGDRLARTQINPVPYLPEFVLPSNKAEAESKKVRRISSTDLPKRLSTELGAATVFFGHQRDRQDDFEEQHPELWSKLYPRRYSDISGYIHPKTIARMNLDLLRGRTDDSEPTITGSSGSPLEMSPIMRCGMPHYFLAETMFEAIAQTQFPEDFRTFETPMPMPGMVIVLPEKQKYLLGPNGTPMRYILISEMQAGEKEKELRELLLKQNPNADISMIDRMYESIGVTPSKSASVSIVGVSSDPKYIYALPVTWDHDDLISLAAIQKKNSSHPPGIAEVTLRLTQFALNTALHFNVVPEYIEKERIEKTAKPKPQKPAVAYWAPNFYGRQFRFPTPLAGSDAADTIENQSKEGRSPRGHMRAAHWRRQWHGPGFSKCKFIRIPFTWVEGNKDIDVSPDETQQQAEAAANNLEKASDDREAPNVT